MALPTTLSLGTRVIVYGATASAPRFYVSSSGDKNYYDPITPGSDIPATGLPGLCVRVMGSAPDFLGSIFALLGEDGVVRQISGVGSQPLVNVSTWTTNGSDPTKSRWQYVDLTA